MSGHTPGPWRVRLGVCRQDHPDTSADVHGRDGQFVVDCGCHESAKANARLIAAAPDLLAAAKSALAQMVITTDRRDTFIEVVDFLEAAIAKAEGAA